MKNKGFTLIEVIVVMAIVATLAGIMVPFMYRVWESNEIEVTKERMLDLKRAMVGDSRMIQNGIRTNYGYVGDYGQLPALISDAISFMPAGYDANKYDKDAWNNSFSYVVDTPDALGRRVSAYIRSAGPDGVSGNDDDIDENPAHKNYTPASEISSAEVTPTNVVQGNAFFYFYNSQSSAWDPVLNAFYAGIVIAYSPSLSQSCCISLGDIPSIPPGSMSPVTLQLTTLNCPLTYKIPVGKIILQAGLYSNSNCSTLAAIDSITLPIAMFIGDGLNAVSANFSTINYTRP